MNRNTIVIIGCGDIGMRVARLAIEEHAAVKAILRSPEKGEKLQQLGAQAIIADLDCPDTLINIPTAESVLFYFAPPPGGGIIDTRMHNFCAALKPEAKPSRVIYISTSGVYGDCSGALVTEATPVNPQTARARRRLDAELTLKRWGEANNVAVIILRVTGIYGPGRLPVQHLIAGQPVLLADEAVFTNRIHAEDLARVCLAAAERGKAGDIFNVSDGNKSTMTDYFNAVADILGYPRPRQVSLLEARQVMSPLMLSYVTESRQMDNRKMLTKLDIKLIYPDLEEGLKASITDTNRSGT